MKLRLDQLVVARGLVPTRSQAESYIKLGKVLVDGRVVTKPAYAVADVTTVVLQQDEQYVSRAGLKLASVAEALKLDFTDKVVLDVGSSTGGFTDYSLKHGAKKVYAVDVGTNQLHPLLRGNPKIELHEQTNILDVRCSILDSRKSTKIENQESKIYIEDVPDIIVIDVSFVSLRELLPHIATNLASKNTQIVAMFKPQFEAGDATKHKGVIKNDAMRRDILKSFELWAKKYFVIIDKADSQVAGSKGNRERFYLLTKLSKVSKNS